MSWGQTLLLRVVFDDIIVLTDADHAEQQPSSAGADDLVNHAEGNGTQTLHQCDC